MALGRGRDQVAVVTATVIYFAHSMRDYSSPIAAQARADIARLLPNAQILDPEQLNWQAIAKRLGSQEAVLDYVIRYSHRVVVLEHVEHIGRGVFVEVQNALRARKPVHVLRDGALLPVRQVVLVDADDWQVRYGRVVAVGSPSLSLERTKP